MRRLPILLLFVLLATPANAQEKRALLTSGKLVSPQAEVHDVRPVHITPLLINSEEGRAAIREFRRRKELGLLRGTAKGAGYAVGDIKIFSVFNIKTGLYENIEFTLKVEDARFNIWVETAELDDGDGIKDHVRDQDIEAMRVAMGEATPPNSFNPNAGIIENDETVFGPPPDVDGDGVTDVLLLDIRDFYDPANGVFSATSGFFNPVDLSGRNNADIIYLDSSPGMILPSGSRPDISRVQLTLAHEYQHLINANVNGGFDLSFVDEGLSEWAEVMNGYSARAINYFQEPTERGKALLSWREGPPFGGPGAYDYQRAGLFTNYISERIGVLNTGSIARSMGIGPVNYRLVLATMGLSLPDLVAGFHVANIINDRAIAPEYGYENWNFRNLRITTVPVVDGTAATGVPPTTGQLNSGAVKYAVWENVADFLLDITGDTAFLKAILVAKPESAEPVVHVIDIGSEPAFFGGNFDRMTLILVNNDISLDKDALTSRKDYNYSSSWSPMQPNFITHEIIYDQGTPMIIDSEIFATTLEQGGMIANRIETPPGSTLNMIQIEMPYENDFIGSGVPDSDPRDYTLTVWGESATGEPGNIIFSLEVQDKSATQTSPGGAFLFDTVDLSSYAAELTGLPPVIFIGATNAGSDLNYIGMIISEFAGTTTPSYIYLWSFNNGNGAWASLDSICRDETCSESLADAVLPIRATFLEPLNVQSEEDGTVLPRRASLHQNYPNPFNPSTSIRYSLPSSGRVKLSVFDVLGRRIATLVDGFQTSGTHEVRFDAGAFVSGLYLYSLETESTKLTRTMTLVK